MLLSRLQPEELGVEEHQGVEQHKRGVDTQLLALPEVLLFHAGEDRVCKGAGRSEQWGGGGLGSKPDWQGGLGSREP